MDDIKEPGVASAIAETILPIAEMVLPRAEMVLPKAEMILFRAEMTLFRAEMILFRAETTSPADEIVPSCSYELATIVPVP